MKESLDIKFKNILFLFIAGMINAFGVVTFLSPVNLYDGGISGTSMLLSQLTPEYLSLSIFLLVLNIPLFIYGHRKQGHTFTIYSIFTVCIYALWAWLIHDVFPIDVSLSSPLAGTDLLLCSLFGGVLSGIGSGLAIRYGGAMDGIEVMGVIFAKKLGITVGTFCMIYNIILYIICGLILSSWILPLYSIITYLVCSKAVDYIVEGFDRAKAAMIITIKPDEVSEALSKTFESGATKIKAQGAYSNDKKTVVYFVVNRFQVTKMKELVHQIDPTAFITISEVVDIFRYNHSSN